MKYRFPPSPTGHLHVGNVRTALYNWLLARKNDDTFLLRIEDTDAERSTPENEARLVADMQWLGLDWDEGPDRDGGHGPYRQSERLPVYLEKLDGMMKQGQVYYCFCSPEELEAERKQALEEKRPPKYNGKCSGIDPAEAQARIDNGEKAAIRFRVEDGPAVFWRDLVHGEMRIEREIIGDFIIARSEGLPAYNFAVTVDDALMGVTHVLRGDDHISNTPRQILLYQAMGFDLPKFGHLPMILGPDGKRLSKRHGATSVSEFRERGYLPEALLNYLALLGWNPGDEREIFTLDELVRTFSIKRVNKAAAIFSFEKLDWLNGQHMRSLPLETILDHAMPFLTEAGILPAELDEQVRSWAVLLMQTFAASSANLLELAGHCGLVYDFDPAAALRDAEAAEVLGEEHALTVLRALAHELDNIADLDGVTFKEATKAVQTATGVKGKELFHPIRVGITGKTSGPELVNLVPLLEQGKTQALPHPILGVRERLAATIELLAGN